MKVLERQVSMTLETVADEFGLGLPTQVTKMGADQKGPLAYVVEQKKYKSLFLGSLFMIVSFFFLYAAFSSERSEHQQRTEELFKVEEHQRLEKQSAEMKLMQITQMLASHLEDDQEEESEMKMIYVNILDAHRRGIEKLEASMPDDKHRDVAVKAFSSMMQEIDGIVGTHERQSTKKADKARGLLKAIHERSIHELEHEVQEDVIDQQVQEIVKKRHINVDTADHRQESQTTKAATDMLDYIKQKVASFDSTTKTEIQSQVRAWQALFNSLEGKVMSDEQITEMMAMVKQLPSQMQSSDSSFSKALLNSAGMPQAVIVRNMQLVLSELNAQLHKGGITQLLSDWQTGTTTTHQTLLGVERMVAQGQLPAKWMADVAAQDWGRSRSPTPAPVAVAPAVEAVVTVHAGAETSTKTAQHAAL